MSLTQGEIVGILRELAGKVEAGAYGSDGDFETEVLTEDMHELMDELPC